MRAIHVLTAALAVASCEQSAADPSVAVAELKAANAEYDRALVAGDAAALNRFLTDDFQIIDDDAAVHGKRNQIEFMTREVDLLHARGDDVRITMLGNEAALVTGRLTGRYRYKGKDRDFAERYTSVWVRHGDRWRVRHEHASLVPGKP